MTYFRGYDRGMSKTETRRVKLEYFAKGL